jgi:DNA-binding ferritin-like protein
MLPADTLKSLLAITYALSIKAQNFHWNVEGPRLSTIMTSLETITKKFMVTLLTN